MMSLRPEGISVFGPGPCPLATGELPLVGVTGAPAIGQSFSVNVSNVPPSLTAVLVLGISSTAAGPLSLPYDLGPAGMPGCTLLVSIDDVICTATNPVDLTLGAAAWAFNLPLDNSLIGATAFAQVAVLNPPMTPSLGGLTRGLQITVQ